MTKPAVQARMLSTASAWNKANPKQYALNMKVGSANLRAKKLGVEGRISGKDIQQLVEENPHFDCFYCNDPLTDTPVKGKRVCWVIDHVVALEKGGRNELKNLVMCCPWCNGSKSDHSVAVWMFRQAGFTV
jgi:5-methylcytosine-specific restriction endonuclease McrA